MPESYRPGRLASVAAAAFAAGLLAGPGGVYAAGLSCAGLPAAGAVTSNPISCTVKCSAGGKLSDAIGLKPHTSSSLTITVSGICVESNDHVPGGITIQGPASGATLQAPGTTTDPVLGISGGATLSNLTITGGLNALRVHPLGNVTGNNLVIEKASNADVLIDHGSLTLNTSTIENSGTDGIDVNWGGAVFLNGGTVRNNAQVGVNANFDGSADIFGGAVLQSNGLTGAQATQGGALLISAAAITKNGFGAGGEGGINIGTGGHALVEGNTTTVSSNSVRGMGVFDGGAAHLQNGAAVASNSGDGIDLSQGGFVKVRLGAIVRGNTGNGIDVQSGNVTVGDNAGPAIIESNKGDGLFMRTNSVANFGNAGTKITGNGSWGIFCTGSPASPLLYGAPIGTVSGNKAGQIHCNTSP